MFKRIKFDIAYSNLRLLFVRFVILQKQKFEKSEFTLRF